MTLKLDRLPERNPSKITVTLTPELKAALDDYAELYRRTYGQKESVAEIIPFMLDSFITADAGFRRARKTLDAERAAKSTPSRSPRTSAESED
ncbi:DUF2274 domain-containing protein [uncultured Erythrobacter sp.]|uniref:DUF2274 domain-containing protein n=1 Tax=uncultured Erythrobacter sp. TaxID=263913 RepID=UPI00260442C4|nr:DUF2274 domain-containing protein [uncultured Erythrobacter sp.]